eukprot:12426289-Karenia_brevis.AAC.1
MYKALSSDTVKAYSCFACANVKTYVRKWAKFHRHDDGWQTNFVQAEMLLLPVKYSLWKWFARNPRGFQGDFSMPLFKERYASNRCAGGNPFLHC